MPDSLQIDTLQVAVQLAGPAFTDTVDSVAATHFVLPDALADTVQVAVVEPPAPPAWTEGLPGVPREAPVDNGTVALLVAILLFMALCYGKSRRLIANMTKELVSVRRRAKDFDERTSNETSFMLLFATQLCVFEGILMGAMGGDMHASWLGVLLCTALCGAYYGAQLIIYNLVGATFADAEGARNWVRGFTASQSLLGFALALPALIAVFYPVVAQMAVTIGILLYVLARLIFILKGFRIFYTGFESLIYFILYLCTLEITPVIFIYTFATTWLYKLL